MSAVATLDMRMHHVLIILTLTSIHGQNDLNRENNKCSIISETVQAMPITFAVKLVLLNVYIIFSESDDLVLHSRSHPRLKLDTIIAISWTVFQLCHSSLAWR